MKGRAQEPPAFKAPALAAQPKCPPNQLYTYPAALWPHPALRPAGPGAEPNGETRVIRAGSTSASHTSDLILYTILYTADLRVWWPPRWAVTAARQQQCHQGSSDASCTTSSLHHPASAARALRTKHEPHRTSSQHTPEAGGPAGDSL